MKSNSNFDAKLVWTRRSGHLVRRIALDESGILRALLALVLLWLAYTGWCALGASTPAALTAFDAATHAITVLTVGHLSDLQARNFLLVWDFLIAFCLVAPRISRMGLWVLAPRIVLSVLPLVMFRDDLFRRFPFVPNASGQSTLLFVVFAIIAFQQLASVHWKQLAANPQLAPLWEDETFSPENRAAQRRRVLQRAALGVPVLVALFFAWQTVWPRYLEWFHARQETAVLSEKISGTLVKKSMPMSALLHRKITMWVYLPPGYDKLSERLPTVYVLHGMPGEVRDCFVKGQIHNVAESLILSRKIRPMILVGWDGQGPQGPSDITNFLDRKDYPMESFMVRELVPYIDRTYRTIAKPQARALIGVSAGGYAAMNLMLKHPDVWRVAASHNGFFDPADDADNMTDILGEQSTHVASWNANNPMKLLKQFRPRDDLHVYLDIGSGDELMDEFKTFGALLKQQKIDCAAHVFPGRHTWEYWSTHFSDSLQFADANFKFR